MDGSVTLSARSADFQRSFVALRYFWGARGPDLSDALAELGVTPAAADLLGGLCHSERSARAQALGAELGRLSAALDERGLWR